MAAGAKIVLVGYYGYKNAGDEIILRQILEGLKNHLPEVEVSVLTRPGSSVSQGFSYFSRYSTFNILKELFFSDALVMGGGGLLQDKTGKFTIYYYFLLMAAAKIFGKKLVVFNQGIGPISSPVNKFIAGFIFSGTDLLIVRDKLSKKLVEELTGERKKVFLGADPVFSLRGKTSSLQRHSAEIAVVLRKWKKFPVKKIAGELDKDLQKCGYERTVLNFHPKYDVFNLPGSKIINSVEPENVLKIFLNFKALIGMRLHALMLGAIAGLPMVGVNYDPKVKSFCSYMDIPCVEVEKFSASDTVNILQDEIKKRPDYSQKLKELDRRLEKSWVYLKKILIK